MFEDDRPVDCIPSVSFEFVCDVLRLKEHACKARTSLLDEHALSPPKELSLRDLSHPFAEQFLDAIQEWEHDDDCGFYSRYAEWFERETGSGKATGDRFFLLEMQREGSSDADWVALLSSDELSQLVTDGLLAKAYAIPALEEGFQEIGWVTSHVRWKISQYKYEDVQTGAAAC